MMKKMKTKMRMKKMVKMRIIVYSQGMTRIMQIR